MDLTTVLGSMCALSAHHTERASPTQLTNSSVITIYQDVLEIRGVAFMRSILEICSVDGDDGGQYSCFAETSVSNDTANFELSVTSVAGTY